MPEILAGAFAIAALVALRQFAARQVAARRGRFVWAFAFPTILVPGVTLW